jgi:VWFA-related protein
MDVHTARAIVRAAGASLVGGLLAISLHGQQAPDRGSQNDAFRFRSGIELINVNATVSDASGRFVSGLQKEDFLVFEDNQPVEVTHFSAERVPVSLGILLDTSGSMAGQKMEEAQNALDHLLYDLLDKDDEVFLYRFSDYPTLLQNWTTDRALVSRALGRITPNGGTALYDAVADAIPLMSRGRNQKKALLVVSDGNDTSSRMSIGELKQRIRESETLVYAIGIDGESQQPSFRGRQPPVQPLPPNRFPIPIPFPGGPRGGGGRFPALLNQFGGRQRATRNDDHVNVGALRDMTDDSGGRTEIIREPRDLNAVTTNIADELSKQYYLGYPSLGKKDGRYHAIRVEMRSGAYRVRARKGYVAS